MNDADLGWVSGIFEGEGHISVRKRGRGRDFNPEKGTRYEISLVVSMTDLDVLESLKSKTGVGIVRGVNSPVLVARGNKPLWRWVVCKRDDVLWLLSEMLPFLHSRRATKALEAINRGKEAQQDYDIHSTSPGAIKQRRHREKMRGVSDLDNLVR